MFKRVTVPIDQDLLREAAKILGTTDPSDTVNLALAEAIEIERQRRAYVEKRSRPPATG